MVDHANKYAQDYRNTQNLNAKSRVHAWTPIDSDKIKKFLGVLLAMGLIRLPRFNDYWPKNTLYKN